MKKILEPTGELCVKFTEDELLKLNINEGDKFSVESLDDCILLKKYETLELDISEFNRETLEFLIKESCEKDVSVNQIIEDCFTEILKNKDV